MKERRRLLAAAASMVALLAMAIPAAAYWTTSAAGDARSTAGNLPGGSQPTATAVGALVTVTWPQSSLAGLGLIGALGGGGYAIRRYADGSSVPVTPGVACGGLIAGAATPLTCSESGVPEGRWRYTVAPRLNLWAGAESPTSLAVLVDVTAPTTTASLSPPLNAAGWAKTPLTVGLTAVDAAGGSGVALIGYRATGAQPISQTAYTAPFAVAGEGITTLSYAATDNAGNIEVAKTLSIRIDRTAPTGAVTAPAAGATLSGLTTVTSSSADALSGVASSVFQVSASGTGVWTAFATASSSPWVGVLDTTTIADGAYELRVVTTDWAGNPFTSGSVAVLVDNELPRGIDIQASNGGVAGTIDSGDVVTYSFSESIVPGSIVAGWTGAARAVTVKVQNGGLTGDRLTVFGMNLGTVRLGVRTWVQSGATSFNAILTMVSPGVFTVRLGSCSSGCASLNVGVGSSTFTWTPSGAATDLAGNAVTTSVVTEAGGPKQNF